MESSHGLNNLLIAGGPGSEAVPVAQGCKWSSCLPTLLDVHALD